MSGVYIRASHNCGKICAHKTSKNYPNIPQGTQQSSKLSGRKVKFADWGILSICLKSQTTDPNLESEFKKNQEESSEKY